MSVSDDENEELKAAIALSLQEGLPARPPSSLADHDASNNASNALTFEDDELQRAIALSLGENEMSAAPTGLRTEVDLTMSPGNTPIVTETSRPPSTHTKSVGIAGLDRKAMEEERLARLNKRKRDPTPERPIKRTTPTHQDAVLCTASKSLLQSSLSSGLEYPEGAIKRTFAERYPRSNDISIDEVLQASQVHIAVISSFMWDSEWLWKKLSPVKTKQIWIMNVKDKKTQQRYIKEMEETGVPNLEVHYPPMEGMIQIMHSKYMLLYGKHKLRIVIPTANMTPIDWGDKVNDWQPAVMENTVFLIDLPRRDDAKSGEKSKLTSFGQNLVHFLEQQKIPQKVIDGLLKFDFSRTEHLGFVHSIGGAHKGELDHPTGLPGLSKVIADMNLGEVESIELDYASASLGSINDGLLQRLHLAATGEAIPTRSSPLDLRKKVRIYFPTRERVVNSIGGADCGGIISLLRKHYSAATFPKECLRDHDSTRRGMLSHNKLLFGRGRRKNGKPFAWVFTGSHNLSEAAWGGQKVLKDGTVGGLNIKNWECGIVMPVPESSLEKLRLVDGEIPPMKVFEAIMEMPFVYPGNEYGTKQPWFRPMAVGVE